MVMIGSTGGTVTVYRFQVYDVVKDELLTSTRMARLDTIDRIMAVRIGVAFEVPASDVDADGFTQKNYEPMQGL